MDAFETAVLSLIELAKKRIASQYDKGCSDFKAYHNSTHTNQVINSARQLAGMALHKKVISQKEAQLCMLAAAFHDIVHNGDTNPDNEQMSAEFASALMHTSPLFTKQDISHVEHMILATKCVQKYPKIIQSPLPHDYPAKLLCDADLATFGMPFNEFYESAMAFFHELHGYDATDEQLRKFLVSERELLSNHTFWTDEATVVYPHIEENCRQIARMLDSR